MYVFSAHATRTLGVWIAIAVISGLGAVVSWRLTAEAAAQVTHTQVVQRQLARYLSAAQDIEISHRGFLLTGNEAFLEPLSSAKADIARIHAALPALVQDNPQQAKLVGQLDTTINERLAEIEKSVENLRGGHPEGRADAIAGLVGRDGMHRLRDQINEAIAQEQQLYEKRSERYRNQSLLLLGAMLATLLSSAGLALLAMIRERQRAETLEITTLALTATNRSLEDRVAERTDELQAERDRAEALLRDVTHRIGNALALVVGFINLHIRHSHDPETQKTLASARDRIHAIASAQRRMNVTNDLDLVRLDSLIDSVIRDVVSAATEEPIALKIEVEPLLAPAQLATSLCVLIQEFVVNAVKHAFEPADGGAITIRLTRCGPDAAVIVVEDDGRGLPQAANSSEHSPLEHGQSEGLGRKIALLLSRQFDGEIAYAPVHASSARPGTRVTVKLSQIPLRVADEPLHAAPA